MHCDCFSIVCASPSSNLGPLLVSTVKGMAVDRVQGPIACLSPLFLSEEESGVSDLVAVHVYDAAGAGACMCVRARKKKKCAGGLYRL